MKTKRIVFIAMFIGFLKIGITSNLMGPLLVTIKEIYNMDYLMSGMVISGHFIGLLITVLISGYLIGKIGKKKFIIIGGLFFIIGLLCSGFSINYLMLLTGIIITGIGFGIYEIGITSLCIDYTVNSKNKGSILNLLNFFYGLGAIAGPVIVWFYVNVFENWRTIFFTIAAFSFIVTIIFLSIKVEEKTSTGIKNNLFAIIKTPFLWICGLAIFIYVGIEVTIYGLLPAYWSFKPGFMFIPASLTATIFWIFLTFGRLAFGKLVDFFGFEKYILLSGLCILVFSFLSFIIPYKFIFLIFASLIGLFLSCIFPSLMGIGNYKFHENSGLVTTFLTVFAGVGGFIIPSGIGKILDKIEIEFLPLIIFILTIIFFIAALILVKDILFKRKKA